MASDDGYLPLFETRRAKGRIVYRVFAVSVFLCIILIWVYRLSRIPKKEHEAGSLLWAAWIGLLAAEFWFGFYWILTQALRWNRVHRHTFRERLSQRYVNDEFPGVDVFVCTADPKMEPAMMVINTVLSVMAYDYPTDKLSVYLSDDAASDLTFYALMEASHFSKHWIPYCNKFNVEPRSPAAFFAQVMGEDESHKLHLRKSKELAAIKRLYEEMENRIETATKLGRITEEVRMKHKGFSHWDSYSSRHDHDTILQILIDGRDPNAVDTQGCPLPTLVYLAREKRPDYFHNFKAGAMNALIRVSSKISNGQVILNVDCDMYSNNSEAVKEALCFFLDEEKGQEVAYVQFPQRFDNLTKNDLYGNSYRVCFELEFQGLDGCGGPLYVGTGCFHKREVLCGRKYSEGTKIDLKGTDDSKRGESLQDLEAKTKALASCTYETNTQWGKEMGLKYGCPVEDVITGLSILYQGWKSVHSNPERDAFLGVGPTTLLQMLVQSKRWSEGEFQIFFTKYSPAWPASKTIGLGYRLAYSTYCLWAPNCLPTLFYCIVPSLYLLKGISLFPKITSPWMIPFAYVISSKYTFSLAEFLWCGGTARGWWNDQRIWLYRRTSSYLFGFIDAILKTLGYSHYGFELTTKVADRDVEQRYKKEIMEFGASSSMFTILATLALLNLFSLIGVVGKVMRTGGMIHVFETMFLQILLCGALVLINWPMYEGLFLRKDSGMMPSSVTAKSLAAALSVVTCFMFLY